MMSRAVCELAGQSTVREAWTGLFRHLNRQRGRGDAGYQPGEKIAIKPNLVGMIWHEGSVDPETYKLIKRQDYMNTAPQMIIALLRQLVEAAGVRPADITICDTLAYLVEEYYEMLTAIPASAVCGPWGQVRPGQVQPSTVPFYWKRRPADASPDSSPRVSPKRSISSNSPT